MKRRLCALLLAVCLPLATGAAIAAPAAVTAQQPQPPAPVPSYWPGQEALSEAGEKVDTEGCTRWPNAYAGVEIDAPAGVLIVHRVPTAGIDDEIRALVAPVHVRLVDAVHPARTLDAWADRLRADTAWWHERGVDIHSV